MNINVSEKDVLKTAFIFNSIEYISYYIIDGNYKDLHGTYINSCESDEILADKLSSLFYSDDGNQLQEKVSIDDIVVAIREGACLVEVGFLP